MRYQNYCMTSDASLMNVFLFPLSSLLEILCSVLYDSLRPVIIHMNHMETLTELCSILKVSYKGGCSFLLKNSHQLKRRSWLFKSWIALSIR